MPNDNGRVIIVTGGAYGIGRATVRRFARSGYRVVIADIDEVRGCETANEFSGGQVLFQHTNVAEEHAVRSCVDRAVAECSRIDVLVNNAGVELYRPADEYSREEWERVIDTNLRGAWLFSKYSMPYLRESKGTIINIASIQGIACEPGIAPYAATKGGLMALTRGMALDFARDGVRVNAVCPGAVHTGMMEKYLAKEAEPQKILDGMARTIPLGRVASPDDIAGVVFFLASADAAYMTGASVVVDGGVLARHAL